MATRVSVSSEPATVPRPPSLPLERRLADAKCRFWSPLISSASSSLSEFSGVGSLDETSFPHLGNSGYAWHYSWTESSPSVVGVDGVPGLVGPLELELAVQ
jgi:hypothetical protein